MQYSLRSLLISLAAAGIGAGVVCWYLPDPPPTLLACVVTSFFGGTLGGQIFGQTQKGGKRALCWLVPPMFSIAVIVPIARWQLGRSLGENATRAWAACRDFAEAEEIYCRRDWKQDGVV